MAKTKNNKQTILIHQEMSRIHQPSDDKKVTLTNGQYRMVEQNEGDDQQPPQQTPQIVDEAAWEKAAMDVLDEFDEAWRRLADS